jgi:hypothetical protein
MKTILFTSILLTFAGTIVAQQTSTETTSQTEAARPASAKNWLLGRWEFDQAHTESNQSAKDSPDVGVPAGATEVISSQLVDKMKGATLVVTESEVTMSRGDGTGKAQRYALIENPNDPNMLQLRQENGEVLTFRREGERIQTKTTGSVNESFFFKRAQ